ncbi:MAG: hypothetical protein KGO49_00410 [Gammaproteobacteria bacterium]|nr:hypothetical protein [Gammaproteobacteria bacterium]
MRKFLHKSLLLGGSFIIITGINGCVTTPQLTSLPANDAVTQGLAELYKQPNYHVHTTVQFTEIHFPESLPSNKTTTAGNKLLAVKRFSDWFEVFSKRNEFSLDGVVDLQHQKFEVTPALTYKAVNAGAFIRVPMMFDLAQSQGYVDLSALSPFVVNTNSEGKYSQFSIEPITKRIDFKNLFHWSQQVALDSSRKFDPRMFRDLPLNSADLALGGVRKVELTATYEDAMNINRAVFNAHREEFLASIKPKPMNAQSTSAKESSDAAIDGFINIISALGTTYGSPDSKPFPFKFNGVFNKVYLLDKTGRLLQSNTNSILEMNDQDKSVNKFKIGFNTTTSYSDYGSANIHFVPSTSNTVPLSESTKGTMIDMIKEAADKRKNATADANAVKPLDKAQFNPKPNLWVGTWKLDLQNHCTETYYVVNNYSTLVTSGEEVSSSFYTLSAKPSDKGFYKLVDRVTSNNGLKDCAGHITPHGDVSTAYLQFNELKKTAEMCPDESGAKCLTLRRVTTSQ